ncbi:MAG: hypothetical protein JSU81_02025 [Candidatus Coatesbacteria bacterium]|nr:MAG: hypothetical protein JSU81_02025 [Candidatus Coatesbacteria bacterium]
MSRLFQTTSYPDNDELSPERRDELIAKIARAIVERNLTAPAIFFLESSKPLSFVGSQVMVFLDPLVRSIFNVRGYNDVRLALEERENVDRLLRTIEQYDADFRAKRKQAKRRKRRASSEQPEPQS